MVAAKKTTSNSALWVGISCSYHPLEDESKGLEFDTDGDLLHAIPRHIADSAIATDVQLFIKAGTDSRMAIRQIEKVARWLRKNPSLLTAKAM